MHSPNRLKRSKSQTSASDRRIRSQVDHVDERNIDDKSIPADSLEEDNDVIALQKLETIGNQEPAGPPAADRDGPSNEVLSGDGSCNADEDVHLASVMGRENMVFGMHTDQTRSWVFDHDRKYCNWALDLKEPHG